MIHAGREGVGWTGTTLGNILWDCVGPTLMVFEARIGCVERAKFRWLRWLKRVWGFLLRCRRGENGLDGQEQRLETSSGTV